MLASGALPGPDPAPELRSSHARDAARARPRTAAAHAPHPPHGASASRGAWHRDDLITPEPASLITYPDTEHDIHYPGNASSGHLSPGARRRGDDAYLCKLVDRSPDRTRDRRTGCNAQADLLRLARITAGPFSWENGEPGREVSDRVGHAAYTRCSTRPAPGRRPRRVRAWPAGRTCTRRACTGWSPAGDRRSGDRPGLRRRRLWRNRPAAHESPAQPRWRGRCKPQRQTNTPLPGAMVRPPPARSRWPASPRPLSTGWSRRTRCPPGRRAPPTAPRPGRCRPGWRQGRAVAPPRPPGRRPCKGLRRGGSGS